MPDVSLWLSLGAPVFFLIFSFSMPKSYRPAVRACSLLFLVASLCLGFLSGLISPASLGVAGCVLLMLFFFSLWKVSLKAK